MGEGEEVRSQKGKVKRESERSLSS
jgi:hypothetical protein